MPKMRNIIVFKVSALILAVLSGIAMGLPLLLGTTTVTFQEAGLALTGTSLVLGSTLGLEDLWLQSHSSGHHRSDNVVPFKRPHESEDDPMAPTRKAA